MKLKSLLLGSAAVLALSTGAQAADPIVEFVSLGVCDTYGITGLTIESDDTCLAISGEVEYEYEVAYDDATDTTTYDSVVDWELAFEATTQTDAGAAVANITFVNADDSGRTLEVDEAYVQFGDTTVLSAGLKGSVFDRELVDDLFTIDDGQTGSDDPSPFLAVDDGGHVIQIESLVADGFTVMVALEDLEDVAADHSGTVGAGVKYDNAGISAELGILMGDLYNNMPGDQPINYYGKVEAEFDSFVVNAGFLADNNDYWVATVGAEATFDMFSLDTEAYFDADDQFGIAGEAAFDATDTIEVYVGASYEELVAVDIWEVYGGVNADVTETIALNAEIGYHEEDPGAEYLYGILGATYAPGGGFETSLEGEVHDTGDYTVTFNASKEF